MITKVTVLSQTDFDAYMEAAQEARERDRLMVL